MVILVVLCMCCFGYYYLVLPNITLKGSKSITIEYDELYEEKGFLAKHFGKDITSKVKVENNIDSKKLGTYEVTYSVNNNGLSKKIILIKKMYMFVQVKNILKKK